MEEQDTQAAETQTQEEALPEHEEALRETVEAASPAEFSAEELLQESAPAEEQA